MAITGVPEIARTTIMLPTARTPVSASLAPRLAWALLFIELPPEMQTASGRPRLNDPHGVFRDRSALTSLAYQPNALAGGI